MDQTQFDEGFWGGSKGWSRVYWDFMLDRVTFANGKDAVNP